MGQVYRAVQVSEACLAEDAKHRAAVQEKLAGVCVDMCKAVGAYPTKCDCRGYVDNTDKTPNVVTWPELFTYMDAVSTYGEEALERWKARSGRILYHEEMRLFMRRNYSRL